jgi:hypothetical protein
MFSLNWFAKKKNFFSFQFFFIFFIFFYFFYLIQATRVYPPYHAGQGLLEAFQAGVGSGNKNLWITLVANWYCWPGYRLSLTLGFVSFFLLTLFLSLF